MLFLATPHGGSDFANLLNNVLRSTPTLSSRLYVSELQKASMSLQDLNKQFCDECEGIELVSLYENQKTHLGFGVKKMVRSLHRFRRIACRTCLHVQIVDKESAVLGYRTEISSSLNADHHGVCKFSSVDDTNYEQVRNVLRMFMGKLKSRGTPRCSGLDGDLGDNTMSSDIDAVRVSNRTQLEQLFGIYDNPVAELDSVKDRIMSGSCRWILERESFLGWRDDPNRASKLLWLTGLPGAGKSILSGFIIDSLLRDPSVSHCCYYFFKSDDQTKRTVGYMLSSIAFQIAIQFKSFGDRLLELHAARSMSFDRQKTTGVWESVFEPILLRQTFERPVFWIIDGLDEADQPELVIKLLSRLGPSSNWRVLIVSRPIREVSLRLNSLNFDFAGDEITPTDTHNDIQSYIDTAVSSIFHDPTDRQDISRKVSDKAQGSFLWVALAMEQLKNNWHTAGDIDQVLNNLPEGMESLYAGMIRMIADQAARPRAIASRILTWAVCSFRPLELPELAAALATEFGEFLSLENTVTQICANFVVVKKSRVMLVHDTARYFLLHKAGGQPLEIDYPSGHDYIAETCLGFLTDPKKNWKRTLSLVQPATSNVSRHQKAQPPPLFDNHPFLAYAVSWWAYHISSAPQHSGSVHTVHSFLENQCLVWIHAISLLGDMRILTRAAQYIKHFVSRRNKESSLESLKSLQGAQDEELKQWSKDLVQIVGRFGDIVLGNPMSLYKQIIPFCPSGSIIRRNFSHMAGISVVGVSSETWDDCLARLTLASDEYATHIICTGSYFVTLIGNGTVIIWHAESFEETRRVSHGEWISAAECSKTAPLLATAGTSTIRIWDLSTGQELHCFEKSTDRRILALSFGKGDGVLFIGYDDSSVHCVDLASLREVWRRSLEEPDDTEHACPHLVSISPDHLQVIVGYRGKPMFAWSLDASGTRPQVCARSEDRLGGEYCASAWKASTPDCVIWRPGLPAVLVVYNDAAVFEWNIEDDALRQVPGLAARDVAISSNGNLLLTSDHNSILSIWTVPEFRLVYQLQETDMVRGLAFSPDGQRFYDIRGSLCNVWEPDALIRPDELGREDFLSAHETALSDPVSAVAGTAGAQITAVVSDSEDLFYCCGKDTGAVVMHDMRTGRKIRKVYGHAAVASVIELAWSRASRFIASADDCGRVIAKRLRKPTPENGSWGVYPLLDFRPGDAVLQLLFSSSEEYLMVSTSGSTSVWNLKTRSEVCRADSTLLEIGSRWLNHPSSPDLVLAVGHRGVRTLRWASLTDIGPPALGTVLELPVDNTGEPPDDDPDDDPEPILAPPPAGEEEAPCVERSISVNQRQVVLYVVPGTGPSRLQGRQRRLMVVDVVAPTVRPAQPKLIEGVSEHVNRFVGCLRGHLVFLDHQYCFCTWDLWVGVSSLRRHFYLPKDWLSPSMLKISVINEHGTLLCPKNGEVAIIRSGIKL